MKEILEKELGLQNPEISILLLDDARITPLNRQYLKRDRPTDVISFPMHDGTFAHVQPQVLGDVVISVETAARQARERGNHLYVELAQLIIHGILHLLGFDHEGTASAGQARSMRRKEKMIFLKLIKNEKIADKLTNP